MRLTGRRWGWRARRDSNSHANLFIYREFFVKIWTEGQVEGQGGGVPLDLLGCVAPQSKSNRANRIPSQQPTKRLAFNQNCKVRPAGGPLFAGNRHRAAIRKIPAFVLSMHVGSSEKAPKRKFEHWWFAEQPSAAGASASGSFQSSARIVAPKGNINLTFVDAVFSL